VKRADCWEFFLNSSLTEPTDKVMRKLTLLPILSLFTLATLAQPKPQPTPKDYPVRAIAIGAPAPAQLDSFINFINNELAPRRFNTMILMVDYGYQFKSHPELAEPNALSKEDVDKLTAACKAKDITIVPQINLLGHQSSRNHPGKLLEQYPEFDETPWIKFPAEYKWPNPDSLYCKSYCPLHPGVHKIVFDVVDELCDAFNAKSFHAGMDEVFYIGMDKCPRCSGKDKADLFANEVNLLRDHLAEKNRTLYIWGDRLIDGYTTGVGGWEGSFNYTWPAIDKISKDVVICDWHYERPDKTAPYFAAHGLKVITATWNRPATAALQARDMQQFFSESAPEMKANFLGMMQTVWSSWSRFYKDFTNQRPDTISNGRSMGQALRNAFPTKGEELKLNPEKTFPIVAYVPCKSPDQIAAINFGSITHIHFAFINPDSLGNFAYNACLDSIVKVAHAQGVRVLASIGGGSAPAYYSNLLQEGKRQRLVNRLAQLAMDYNLDGIDVDLEGSRIDANYEKFVIELRSALRPAHKLLTAAIATFYKDQFTDNALAQFDYMTLMSYDKTGPWKPDVKGQHSPYDMAVSDLDYWVNTRHLDKNNLYLGVPFYGYSFGPNGASSMKYKDIVATYKNSEKKDELKTADGSRLYYNGIPTIRKKVKLAKKNAGGIMFWEYMGDTTGDKSLLKAINDEAYSERKDVGKTEKSK
jgi:GH18 family chitinase